MTERQTLCYRGNDFRKLSELLRALREQAQAMRAGAEDAAASVTIYTSDGQVVEQF